MDKNNISEEHKRFLEWRNIEVGYDNICLKCGGSGVRAYSSTSTWRGGIGGQQITSDVCNECWGSGKTNEKGFDLRKVQ